MSVETLQNKLKDGIVVVYIAPDFTWKDMAYDRLEELSNYVVSSDPEDMELYRMYEFSDRFIVLDESNEYGSIWNYVRKGLITAEEALDTLFKTVD